MGGATWSVGHHDKVFGVTAPESYVPRMMDQEYAPEDDPGLFLGEDWEEGALEVEAFQEPTENRNNRACNNSYRVPLISQEQAYANHGLPVNQVTASADHPGAATSLPPGKARWGLRGGSQEQGPSPRHAKPGDTRR